MESLYKSKEGKNEILKLYDEKLEQLNINYEYKVVDTNFGKTNIIITGEDSNPPIILMHGSNACAPIALETYANLNSHFKVYAIDVLAQPNKSAEIRLSMKDDSYGKWMNEIIDLLGLEKVTLAGFSLHPSGPLINVGPALVMLDPKSHDVVAIATPSTILSKQNTVASAGQVIVGAPPLMVKLCVQLAVAPQSSVTVYSNS